MQIFLDRSRLPPQKQLYMYHRYFKFSVLAKLLLLLSFLGFMYGLNLTNLSNMAMIQQDRYSTAFMISALVWFFAGVGFLIVFPIQRIRYYLPRHILIAISIEEAIKMRNVSSGFLIQKEQASIGKYLWRLGVSLALFKSNRPMLPSEKKAISDFYKRYPYIRELILIKDKDIFTLLEPHLQNLAVDFRINSMPKFVVDYEAFRWELDRIPDYWEIRSNYPRVKFVAALWKSFNILNECLEKTLSLLKTFQGLGFAIGVIITSILRYFFPK